MENKTKKVKRRNVPEGGEEEDNDDDEDDDSYKSLTIADMAAQCCENRIFIVERRYLSIRHPF